MDNRGNMSDEGNKGNRVNMSNEGNKGNKNNMGNKGNKGSNGVCGILKPEEMSTVFVLLVKVDVEESLLNVG